MKKKKVNYKNDFQRILLTIHKFHKSWAELFEDNFVNYLFFLLRWLCFSYKAFLL